MLVLLEKLNAKERVVFILKEALDYSHEEIAEVLSVRVENSRKLLSWTKYKLKKGDMAVGQRHLKAAAPLVLGEFVQALQSGDVARLEALLVNDVNVTADGGPDVQVVREFTMGRVMTIELLLYVSRTYHRGLRVQLKEECHQPALLYFNGETLVNCQVFELDEAGKIHHIYSIIDPEKLKDC